VAPSKTEVLKVSPNPIRINNHETALLRVAAMPQHVAGLAAQVQGSCREGLQPGTMHLASLLGQVNKALRGLPSA